MKIHEKDFVAPQLQKATDIISVKYDSLSRNNIGFLDLIDQETVKADGHY